MISSEEVSQTGKIDVRACDGVAAEKQRVAIISEDRVEVATLVHDRQLGLGFSWSLHCEEVSNQDLGQIMGSERVRTV